MKILIFGGTGAMGTPLVKILADKGHEVYVTSRQLREYGNRNIHCIRGNSHDMDFLESVLKGHYDVLVDFMVYTLPELQERIEMILSSVGQYVFISSCRVYAESKTPITEETPRLLDICEDEEYLATEEYALAKAREENVLFASKKKNWTIVRPSVTYNSHRLQLGCYELEDWLYRVLNGRPVVFFENLMDKITPMTYGGDVAKGIAGLIGNPAASGEVFQIVTPETMTWKEIMDVYFDTIKQYGGVQPQTLILPHAEQMEEALGRAWRLKYNRIYNRAFDSSKLDAICGGLEYTPMREGLAQCLTEFLQGERRFGTISFKSEAYMDRLTHTRTPLSAFENPKDSLKYVIARYTPYFSLDKRRRKRRKEKMI